MPDLVAGGQGEGHGDSANALVARVGQDGKIAQWVQRYSEGSVEARAKARAVGKGARAAASEREDHP